MTVRGRVLRSFGALVEREFRLLFGATLVTSLGDAIALIALAFAVLDVTGASGLGLVIGARQAASAAVVVFGGVLADRMPRNRVLVGASLLQGAAQAATAALVLSHRASVGLFVVFAMLWGLGDGLVTPAETGLIPQTVSPARLQQANALQGLCRSSVRVLGPAVGGALVVAFNPGWALVVDAVSFVVCALLLARIRVDRKEIPQTEPFLRELREGWGVFRSRTWLWSTVLLFGIGNFFGMFWPVLGPVIAEGRLGGAGSWALILAAGGVGAVLGGLSALRLRPARPLVACVLWALSPVVGLIALALATSTWLVAGASFLSGAGLAIHVALWFTVFQREVPEHAQSRVSSLDALGSYVLTPLGAAAAGPIASSVGSGSALWLAAAVILITDLSMLAIPSVWNIRAATSSEMHM